MKRSFTGEDVLVFLDETTAQFINETQVRKAQ